MNENDDDGPLKEEGMYKDDKKDGYWRIYYDNGKLKLEATYKDGMLNGFYKSYLEDGTLIKGWKIQWI